MRPGSSPISTGPAGAAAVVAVRSSLSHPTKSRSTRAAEDPALGSFNAFALILSLLGSAYLVVQASAGRAPALSAWCALIPIFVSILVLRPALAGLAGAFWGGAVFALGAWFANNGVRVGFPVSFSSAAALSLIPAAYSVLGSFLTRSIGFSPFVLGVGWLGVELALVLLNGSGLFTQGYSQNAFLGWIAHTFGSVLVAFVVATTIATLVVTLNHACAILRGRCPALIGVEVRRYLESPRYFSLPCLAIGSCRPRGPP